MSSEGRSADARRSSLRRRIGCRSSRDQVRTTRKGFPSGAAITGNARTTSDDAVLGRMRDRLAPWWRRRSRTTRVAGLAASSSSQSSRNFTVPTCRPCTAWISSASDWRPSSPRRRHAPREKRSTRLSPSESNPATIPARRVVAVDLVDERRDVLRPRHRVAVFEREQDGHLAGRRRHHRRVGVLDQERQQAVGVAGAVADLVLAMQPFDGARHLQHDLHAGPRGAAVRRRASPGRSRAAPRRHRDRRRRRGTRRTAGGGGDPGSRVGPVVGPGQERVEFVERGSAVPDLGVLCRRPSALLARRSPGPRRACRRGRSRGRHEPRLPRVWRMRNRGVNR